jgi:hypothetical protein
LPYSPTNGVDFTAETDDFSGFFSEHTYAKNQASQDQGQARRQAKNPQESRRADGEGPGRLHGPIRVIIMRFSAPKPQFGRRARQDVPAPITGKAIEHHTAQLAEAADVLRVIPAAGETLHAIMTGRYDLMQLVAVLVGKIGPCMKVRIATLSFNARNLVDMLQLLDSQAVGRMDLLASAFFRDHNRDLWQDTLDEFRQRHQRAAAARSHCKVITLACTDGRRFVLEGSANLRTNGNREQLALTQDVGLHDWYAAFIEGMVGQHEGESRND